MAFKIRPSPEYFEVCSECGRRLNHPSSTFCAFCREVLHWFDPQDGWHLTDRGHEEDSDG